jgi:hypothetical protein
MNWIIAHLIGDYILQNDWMATGKKQKSWICAVHVLTYLVPFLFCDFKIWQIALIGIQHFAQDRTNFIVWFMNIKGQAKFASPPMAPWSIILTDNIIHILWIYVIINV